ncbi:MAG: DNA mismatch repair endonuclease MutL [Bacteroidota bacterium]|nr:DNA mismatch repair endonuclease MutL [Bacteroidota bacterium]
MSIIQLLPENVANQIAAGEVIQRPSSVVKELLENSIDAEAQTIKLYIKDSGKTLLQVVDDGYGMDKDDIRLCFKRHATSKINNISDLSNIKSMGFRGEAMASIAAISHIELESKTPKNQIGHRILIKGGEVIEEQESTTVQGTSIKIKHIFYNVPARRKFLKSNQVEMRHIIEEFYRVALANSTVKMEAYHNEKNIFYLESSNFRQRIVNVIGNKMNEKLVPVKEETDPINITGFISKPEFAKRTRGEQYFFVNSRFIKSLYLNRAILTAFEALVPTNTFPSFFIHLSIDPDLIDVNIHPTKTEIKFQDEKLIYSILKSTIKKSLGQYNIAPSIDFDQEVAFNNDLYQLAKPIIPPKIKVDKSYNPFKKETNKTDHEFQNLDYQESIKNIIEEKNENYKLIQVGNKFILSYNEKQLTLIHQRRAHKRILFDYFSLCFQNQKEESQRLLFEEELHLNNKEIVIFKEIANQLKLLGFRFVIKKQKIHINSIPVTCQGADLQLLIEVLLEKYKNNEDVELDKQELIQKSLAQKLAIPEKKQLHKNEIQDLYTKLFNCSNSTSCPNGKPIVVNLKLDEIEKYF